MAVVVALLVGSTGCGEVTQPRSGDASPDADHIIDAAVDSSMSQVKYDVAYANEITFPYNYTGLSGFLLVVNRAQAPLSLVNAAVASVSDDNPDVTWTLELDTPSTIALPLGHAAGFLSQEARLKIVGSSLVTEPIDDDVLDFRMSFASFPPIGIDVHAQARLRIGGVDLVLPFTVHVVAGDRTSALNSAIRINMP